MELPSLLNVFLLVGGLTLDGLNAWKDWNFHTAYVYLRIARMAFVLLGVFLLHGVFTAAAASHASMDFASAALTAFLIALNLRGIYDAFIRANKPR